MSRAMRMVALVLVLVLVVAAATGASGQVHHVVGGDRGWDLSSDVASWSSGRIFRIGDKIWFTYSAAQDSIMEVKSKGEYESCDLANPIKTYTDGLDVIPLLEEGIRYFVSSKPEVCKKGLKLHVAVIPDHSPDQIPKLATSEISALVLAAAGPTAPSGSSKLNGNLVPLLMAVFGLCYIGL